ncbi:hypothetical protein LWC35_18200 [Pseudonocardia kujensis]|uniref:hypothetical protein n=1 Tax=Pseudonocardia kujensis TaxID=1128675 RepID=UPI001E357FEA|nr:hypothetical protein [Pseudonocardia kujensis]MCE0764823.1 hypothetical protein [Pseudonocardia kujensis]
MSNSPDTTSASDENADKWKDLSPAPREMRPHPRDSKPSEYGLPVGMGEHPLQAFYREIREEEEAEDRRRARAIDARHTRGAGDAR